MKKISSQPPIKTTPAVQVVLADGRQWFFTTIKAIFAVLSPLDVGIGYVMLSRQHLKVGQEYRNEYCTIRKILIVGLKQQINGRL